MKRTVDEIKAEVISKLRDSDESGEYTQFEHEVRAFEAKHSISPHVEAFHALDRILGSEMFYSSELDDWIDPYDYDYLEKLADQLEICVVENCSDKEIEAAYNQYEDGKEYLKFRSYVSRIFYQEISNAIAGKESLLVVDPSSTPNSIESTRLLKSSVYIWALKKLKIQITEWSLDEVKKPQSHISPKFLEAVQMGHKARTSVLITVAVLGMMLAKHKKIPFSSEEDAHLFNSTEIAREGAAIYNQFAKNLDPDAPAKRGQEVKSITRRLDLARDLLKLSLDKY